MDRCSLPGQRRSRAERARARAAADRGWLGLTFLCRWRRGRGRPSKRRTGPHCGRCTRLVSLPSAVMSPSAVAATLVATGCSDVPLCLSGPKKATRPPRSFSPRRRGSLRSSWSDALELGRVGGRLSCPPVATPDGPQPKPSCSETLACQACPASRHAAAESLGPRVPFG